MKKIAAIGILFVLVGCSEGNESITDPASVKTRCLDGVEYYLYTEKIVYSGFGFMAPRYNRDGTISLCEGERR